MDDSVIKVLRRNGSWQNSNKVEDKKKSSFEKNPEKQFYEDELKLDEKFQILAREIKKRMSKKEIFSEKETLNKNKKNKEYANRDGYFGVNDIKKLKIKILPYLKEIEKLVVKRQTCLQSINEIDADLDIIYKKISNIREDYLNTINKLKNNMNLFDDSLDIIKNVKEEK